MRSALSKLQYRFSHADELVYNLFNDVSELAYNNV